MNRTTSSQIRPQTQIVVKLFKLVTYQLHYCTWTQYPTYLKYEACPKTKDTWLLVRQGICYDYFRNNAVEFDPLSMVPALLTEVEQTSRQIRCAFRHAISLSESWKYNGNSQKNYCCLWSCYESTNVISFFT